MIRLAKPTDAPDIAQLEKACFSADEAIDLVALTKRLSIQPFATWVFEQEGQVIACITGLYDEHEVWKDSRYFSAQPANPQGSHLFLLGVETHPDYQHQGLMNQLFERMLSDTQEKKAIHLTCHRHLVPYYQRYGFKEKGVSPSKLGEGEWLDLVRINE